MRFIDGRTAFIRRPAPNGGVQVSRLDLSTGTRMPVRTIAAPSEAAGMGGIGMLALSADGNAYVYGFIATNSDLFLVRGLR